MARNSLWMLRLWYKDFFGSGFLFYLLLSPYLCFISFLYLHLYVLGDDALISKESYMQTKHLCVLIYIWTKGEVGAPLNLFKPSSEIFYWPLQGGTSFVDPLCFFYIVFAMSLCASVYMGFETDGKGLASWLSFVVSNCEFVTFPLVSWVRCGTWLYRFLIFAHLLTQKELSLCQIYFSRNRHDPVGSGHTFIAQKVNLTIRENFWARIYTTNVGIYRLLHDILPFLILFLGQLTFVFNQRLIQQCVW